MLLVLGGCTGKTCATPFVVSLEVLTKIHRLTPVRAHEKSPNTTTRAGWPPTLQPYRHG
jgi:hypothetical protein